MSALQPIRLWSRVQGAIDEVDAAFRVRAFDSALHGGETAVALFGPAGASWASGTESTPFLTALLGTWMRETASETDSIEGHVILSNDPYVGGCSLSDLRVVTGLQIGDHGVAWLASSGHYPDIGGRVPGGVCPNAWDISQEGVRIPKQLVATDFRPDVAVVDLLAANTRHPDAFRGNLLAQIAALATGAHRLRSLLDRCGPTAFVEAVTRAREESQSLLVDALSSFVPGTYISRDRLDPSENRRPFRLVTRATVESGRIKISFEGSDLVSGSGACPFSAVRAGCEAGLRQLLPEVPSSADLHSVLDLQIPAGTFLDATFPQAVSTASEIAGRVTAGMGEALSKAVHGRGSAADAGGGNLIVLEGLHQGRPFYLRLAVGSGGGASGRGDGLTNVGASPRRGAFPSIEDLEREYPIRVLRYERRGGSGGAGRYRGGDGTLIELRVEADSRLTLYLDRGERGAGGHYRGARGSTSSVKLHKDGHWARPPRKVEGLNLKPGDRLRLETAGGGGYGHPYERAIRLLSDDLSAQVLTRRKAALEHGVLFRSDKKLDYDSAATFKLRSYRLTSADVEGLVDEIEEME